MGVEMKSIKKKKHGLEAEFVEDFDQLINQFTEESDRAAVILGTAKLDYLLGQLLNKYMVASYTSDDPLLKNDGPISTFSSRTHLAYRLGLIDSEFAKALHLVRKTRNEFAHDVKDSQLNNPPHRDRIKDLALLFQNTPLFDEVRKTYFSDANNSSANFFTVIAILIMRLETIIIKVKPLSSNKAFGIRIS
jgi:DNA-binding MltR family transcriptional regulator